MEEKKHPKAAYLHYPYFEVHDMQNGVSRGWHERWDSRRERWVKVPGNKRIPIPTDFRSAVISPAIGGEQ